MIDRRRKEISTNSEIAQKLNQEIQALDATQKLNEAKINELASLNVNLSQQKNDFIIKVQNLERDIAQH
jgi:hypothetical protein